MKELDLDIRDKTEVEGVGSFEYTVTLPSKGKIYDPEVTLKTMTAKEEDILSNSVYIQKKTVFRELVKSVVRKSPVPIRDLLVGDRDFILLNSRIDAYGNDYDVDITCPGCGKRNKITIDLSKVPTIDLELDPVEKGKNLFEVELPCGSSVVFSFWTVGMQEDFDRKNSKGLSPSSGVTGRLFSQIYSIDGEEDRQIIKDTIENMLARDSSFFRKYVNSHVPGIDLRYDDFECQFCGHSEGGIDIPLDAGFFWPELG